jgi:hypothetical protein
MKYKKIELLALKIQWLSRDIINNKGSSECVDETIDACKELLKELK